MNLTTQLLDASDPQNIEKAAALLRQGEVAAIPTETVYGLAANALDERAVAKIFEVKGRPSDNPLIVHIAEVDELKELTSRLPDAALELARRFWPGPLTMVLPSSSIVPALTRAGLDSVGIRLPAHPVARKLIKAAGVPLAAPSANISGRPSPTSAAHCFEDLAGRVQVILDGGPCNIGVESTVVSLTDGAPRVLRPGAVTPEQIKAAAGSVVIDPVVYQKPDPDAPVASPGVKHTHYAPKAEVVVLHGNWESCKRFLAKQAGEGVWALVFEEELADCPLSALSLGPSGSDETQAMRLFALLRELDEKGARQVYARAPRQEGVGLAVYNRLIRAAGFRQLAVDREGL
ncbi:MAG: L-threonylcarbamoyladenylate synthase [Oscillospiraceae bacterium]|nr:L-threonylcarbamoyladenylate synthase [Oscillospiraceae bacterium]